MNVIRTKKSRRQEESRPAVKEEGAMGQPNYIVDHRREARAASDQRVIVTNLTGARFSFSAQLTDSSPGGLGLKLLFPLEDGMVIAVEWGDTIVVGSTAYCRKSLSHYRAGLRREFTILANSPCAMHQDRTRKDGSSLGPARRVVPGNTLRRLPAARRATPTA